MYNIAVLISGLSIAISIFLIIIAIRATRRRKVRILSYLEAVFALILISNVVYVFQTFNMLPGISFDVTFLLSVELIVLLLFYASIVRGLG